MLAAGETYVGNVELPDTQHPTPVKVTSSSSCPDRRLTPPDVHLLPVIKAQSQGTPAMSGWGARGWAFECVRFEPATGGSYNVVQLVNVPLGGGSFRNTDSITFDRIYIVPSEDNVRKAIHADGGNITLTRSYIANVRQPDGETKGFAMQEGPGPVRITDNYIEAASINILFGGGDTSSSEHVPNDILIENNHLAKRPEWEWSPYLVKNLLELKTATDVTVRNNLMEYGSAGGQGEVGVMLQPVNDTANSPWNRITDVLFAGNVVRGVDRGMAILGYEWQTCCNSGRTARITIVNNLFITHARFLYAAGEIEGLTIDHNTIDNNGPSGLEHGAAAILELGDVSPTSGHRAAEYAIAQFVFTNNLMKKGEYGWVGSGHPLREVTSLLESTTSSYIWTNNIVAGAAGHAYPNCGGDFDCFPSLAAHDAQFNADYTLVEASRYRSAATDGTDLGWTGGERGGSQGGSSGGSGGGGGSGSPTPFHGVLMPVPGLLQAEDFDLGGQGVAYRDGDGGNNGGAYRTGEDVDISSTADSGGGYAVGWAAGGEWLTYTVNVTASGTYDISVRVAHAGSGGTFHIEANGVDITGPLAVPATGGWDTWTTITKGGVHLDAGAQVWRLVMDTNGHANATGNFNWIQVASSSGGSSAYGGSAAVLPGTLQAEDFDSGGQGVAYQDGDGGNNGGAYRTGEDVDISQTSDVGGGYAIGWAGSGEWLTYTVDVGAAGTYDIGVRVAQEGSGGTFHIEVGGVDVTGPMTVPATGGWDTWTTITRAGVYLNAGPQVVRLVMDSNGHANASGNFNWISVTPSADR